MLFNNFLLGDDHSENSEGSASTSGCSSLVSSHKERSNCLPVPNRRLVQSPFDSLRSGFNRRDVTSRKDVLPGKVLRTIELMKNP